MSPCVNNVCKKKDSCARFAGAGELSQPVISPTTIDGCSLFTPLNEVREVPEYSGDFLAE